MVVVYNSEYYAEAIVISQVIIEQYRAIQLVEVDMHKTA